MDGKSGEPIRKSVVILRPIAAAGNPAAVAAGQHSGVGTTTDAAGKFLLHDVEPGTYRISAERDAYVAAMAGRSQIVSLEAGGEKSDLKLKLKLLRTGSITGRVLDPDGEPLMNASVRVQFWKKSQSTGAQGGPLAATNDRGEYRIFNIAPGQYRLLASYTPGVIPRLDVRMQSTGASGEGASGYPNLYYPNSTIRDQASAVTVEAGSELQGFDFQLRRQHAVTVQGRVIGLGTGLPFSFAFVSLTAVGQEAAPTHESVLQDPSGNFELINILPGTYRLAAARVGLAADGTSDANSLTAERILQVDEADVKGVQLILGAPIRLSGRFITPEGRALPTGLTILLERRENFEGQPGSFAAVAADGSFKLENVPAGDYSVLIGATNQQGDDSYISEIRFGDTDALADGLSLTANPSAALEIRLKANGGTLELEAQDEKGLALPGAQVWLVPDSPKQRQFALYGDCRTDSKGSCRITGVTPGRYHAYAFASDIVLDRHDPDALKAFEKFGKAVEFEEGEKHRLKLIAAPVE